MTKGSGELGQDAITTWDEAINLKKDQFGKKTVLVGGCFDILHYGHIKFLTSASREGDFLVVALESDEFIRTHKGRAPVHSQEKRAEMVAALKPVNRVIMLPYPTDDGFYFNLVKTVAPKVIAVTAGDAQIENKRKQAILVGADVKEVTPHVTEFSTTKIIRYENVPCC